MADWCSGYYSALVFINEVALHWARLLDGMGDCVLTGRSSRRVIGSTKNGGPEKEDPKTIVGNAGLTWGTNN